MELDLNDYGDDFMIMIMKKTSYDAVYDQPYISVPKTSEFQSGPRVVKKVLNTQCYPACVRSALRALGLLLADGALTVGRGKTF